MSRFVPAQIDFTNLTVRRKDEFSDHLDFAVRNDGSISFAEAKKLRRWLSTYVREYESLHRERRPKLITRRLLAARSDVRATLGGEREKAPSTPACPLWVVTKAIRSLLMRQSHNWRGFSVVEGIDVGSVGDDRDLYAKFQDWQDRENRALQIWVPTRRNWGPRTHDSEYDTEPV